ncbi:rrp41 [Symbiodinium natans]|uniref:Rrp41 protein n=1 Tax=Symbiodinium natans TaxID=878477 RepID=A0A812HYN2_9DINO|nr:rrp41 [Symbiodinium natans]
MATACTRYFSKYVRPELKACLPWRSSSHPSARHCEICHLATFKWLCSLLLSHRFPVLFRFTPPRHIATALGGEREACRSLQLNPAGRTGASVLVASDVVITTLSVILLERYAKTAFDITLLVLEDDGAVLTACLAAAAMALADARVEMRDLVAGATIHLLPESGRYRQWLGKAFWVDGIKRSGRYSRGLSSKWCLASASLATVEDRRSVETLSTLADFSSSPAAQACRQLDRLHIMVGVPDEPVVSCGTTSYAATLPSARALELMRIGYQCLPALATLTGAGVRSLSTRAFAASPVRSSPLQASTYVAPPRQLSFCKGLPCFQQTSARTASALAAVGESQAAGFGIAASHPVRVLAKIPLGCPKCKGPLLLFQRILSGMPAPPKGRSKQSNGIESSWVQRLNVLQGEPLDPVLFNGLVCALPPESAPILIWPFVFTAGGALGGVLFVFAALFSFVAIPRAGLATAQAVWSCSAIIVSFGWGAIGPAEVAAPVADITGSIAALALLIAGALVIVNCDGIAKGLSGESAREASASGMPTLRWPQLLLCHGLTPTSFHSRRRGSNISPRVLGHAQMLKEVVVFHALLRLVLAELVNLHGPARPGVPHHFTPAERCSFLRPPLLPFFWDQRCKLNKNKLGCWADGVHAQCRFCGEEPYTGIPCPMNAIVPSAGSVCRFDNPPVTPFFWDSSCYMGMKGCLADGKHIGCRFCGAGNYSDIECPASVCSFTDEPWTPYYWDDFCQWGMLGCNADGIHIQCRFCDKVPFQSVSCPEKARPAYPDGKCWFPVKPPEGQGHFWDETCKWGRKGCWADGVNRQCRFCGSRLYADIPCPNETEIIP